MSELLGCPFCGRKGSVKSYGRRNWVATCSAVPDKDDCPAVIDVGADTRLNAIARWNTRAAASMPERG